MANESHRILSGKHSWLENPHVQCEIHPQSSSFMVFFSHASLYRSIIESRISGPFRLVILKKPTQIGAVPNPGKFSIQPPWWLPHGDFRHGDSSHVENSCKSWVHQTSIFICLVGYEIFCVAKISYPLVGFLAVKIIFKRKKLYSCSYNDFLCTSLVLWVVWHLEGKLASSCHSNTSAGWCQKPTGVGQRRGFLRDGSL